MHLARCKPSAWSNASPSSWSHTVVGEPRACVISQAVSTPRLWADWIWSKSSQSLNWCRIVPTAPLNQTRARNSREAGCWIIRVRCGHWKEVKKGLKILMEKLVPNSKWEGMMIRFGKVCEVVTSGTAGSDIQIVLRPLKFSYGYSRPSEGRVKEL